MGRGPPPVDRSPGSPAAACIELDAAAQDSSAAPVGTAVDPPTGAAARGNESAGLGAIDFTGQGLPSSNPGPSPALPAGFVANPGGSAGNLCLGPGILRLATGNGPADTSDTWHGALELPAPGQAGAFQVQAGATWHFQIWYRQPGTPASSNFSGSLAITFD